MKLQNYVLGDSSFLFQVKPTQVMSSTLNPLWKASKQEMRASDEEKGEHVL